MTNWFLLFFLSHSLVTVLNVLWKIKEEIFVQGFAEKKRNNKKGERHTAICAQHTIRGHWYSFSGPARNLSIIHSLHGGILRRAQNLFIKHIKCERERLSISHFAMNVLRQIIFLFRGRNTKRFTYGRVVKSQSERAEKRNYVRSN